MLARGKLAAALALASALAPGIVRADTLKLKDGTVLERVKVTFEGDRVRASREAGSRTFPREDVEEVVRDRTFQDEGELLRRKTAAGQDPDALLAVASWCAGHGFEKEGRDLRELARGAALDRRLDAIAELPGAAEQVKAYLQLASDMKREGRPELEAKTVLGKALALDPENVEVRAALGQVKRGRAWVSLADAARLDAEAFVRAQRARGLVLFEGQWLTPAEIATIQQARDEEQEHEAKMAALEAERLAALESARLAALQARNTAPTYVPSYGAAACGDGPYFIAAMPAYAPVRHHHQRWTTSARTGRHRGR